MPRTADTQDVRELVDAGAQLLEVLPKSAFAREHLPGAVNIPLPHLTPGVLASSGLDPQRATVVYSATTTSAISVHAAPRCSRRYGFTDVYDYSASKTAWLGDGLPVEGTVPVSSRCGVIARAIPTCSIDESVADVTACASKVTACVRRRRRRRRARCRRGPRSQVLGDTSVGAVMQPGPPSVRPSITAAELADAMDRDGRRYVLVTTTRGGLIGLITSPDLHGHH